MPESIFENGTLQTLEGCHNKIVVHRAVIFLGSMLPQYMAVCVSSVRQKNFMATSMQLHKRKDDNGIGLAAVAQDNSGGLCQTWN